ncbi:hypothetical protein D5086_030836 [Populus alba]|uniref:Uncharacterized protein n=1 Tax=Populus alba TaxID=43335 RepID=A0ACC4APQ7_POPAL
MIQNHGMQMLGLRKVAKKYGVIQCDPIVLKGLEKTALDTLGNTKWSVNKRVLSVLDRIWSNGCCLADLVDHSDVPLPERPETEFLNFPSFEMICK